MPSGVIPERAALASAEIGVFASAEYDAQHGRSEHSVGALIKVR